MLLERFVTRIRGIVSIDPAAALAIRPFSTGVFKEYLQYKCKYAISTSDTGAFIQENICKKN